MKMPDETVERLLAAVQHTLDGKGPASITLSHPSAREPAAVVFIIPAPVGPLVDTFLHDLYMMLGWHVESTERREIH